MPLSVIGLNHKTAPIEIRERFYLTPIQQDLLLSELKCAETVYEAFVLSTCNRTELYVHHMEDVLTSDFFIRKINAIKELSYVSNMADHFYNLKDDEAVNHLMRVTCGLDSLVIGEKQILGQVKKSLQKAQARGMFTRTFNLLAAAAIRAGKKAHSETDISFGGSSVSWAAITTAEQELGTLQGKTMLMIGAGKMSELTVEQLMEKQLGKLYLINRTHANAEALAQKYGGEAIQFIDIKEIFSKIDVCICAADAPHYILDYPLVAKITPQEPQKKIVLIDISMPRNIDPRVGALPFVKLYHLDDLNEPINSSMQKRMGAIKQVEHIIADKIRTFYFRRDESVQLTKKEISQSVS